MDTGSTFRFDHDQLRAFLELQHRLAAPFAPESPGGSSRGLLMLSRAEVFLQADKDDVWVNIRLAPGDLENSLYEAGLAEGRDNVNVYFSWHVLRPDLPAKQRGKVEDVIATLALVTDFDNGPGHTEANNFDPETFTIPGLSIAPSAVIETSPGNYQAIFAFDTPVLPKDAAVLAELLWKVAQCDPSTKKVDQPWRVPGTINWPNRKKIREGRTPVLARWAKPFDGSTVSYEALKAALEAAVEGTEGEPDEGDGGGDVAGPDTLAENELAKYIAKIREARDKSNKNALILNSGVRLGRFIGAGRLDEERVIREVHDAVRSWGDPTEPERKAAGTFRRGLDTGKKNPLVAPKGGQRDAVLDDNRLAMHFGSKFQDKVRYVKQWGAWMIWADTHWKQDNRNTVFDAIRRANLELKVKSVSKAKNTEAFASAFQNISVEADLWDRDPYLLGTPGGTVDLKTGELRPARQDDYITKLTAFTPADAADETTCPRWLRFVDEVTCGDAGMIRFLQQWFGYGLTGDTSEQCLVFLFGPGGNGKGVLIQTIQAVGGDYAHEAATDVFLASYADKHTTSLAALNGKRMVFASETEEGRPWAIGTISRLTGGDLMTARFMRQDDVTFKPVLKLTVIGNHQPSLPSVGPAERRRFNLVGFSFIPSKVDKKLTTTLKGEGPGILRWMIDGCLDWQKSGLTRPAIITRDTEEYLDGQDHFKSWCDEYTKLHPGTTIGTPTNRLFASWRSFAEGRNVKVGRESELIQKLVGRCGCRLNKHLKIKYKDERGDERWTEVRGLEGISLVIDSMERVTVF
jgi:putative DNA primase/helicase